MPLFSRRTLGKLADASASIPLRLLVRAFEAAGIRVGEDPGGPDALAPDRMPELAAIVTSALGALEPLPEHLPQQRAVAIVSPGELRTAPRHAGPRSA